MGIRGGTNSSSSLGTLRTPPDFFEQNLSLRAYSRGKCLKIPLCMLGRNRYLRYYQFGNTNQERFSFYIYRLRAPRPRIGSPAQFSTRAFLILVIKNHGINIARDQWHPQLWKLTASKRIKIENRAWRYFKEHKKSFLYLMNFI